MMAVQPRTLWRVPGGAAAHTTAGCTTDDPVQIGPATEFFRTPLEIEREGVMALYWRARPLRGVWRSSSSGRWHG